MHLDTFAQRNATFSIKFRRVKIGQLDAFRPHPPLKYFVSPAVALRERNPCHNAKKIQRKTVAPMTEPAHRTKIQQRNRSAILDAALEVFSSQGFRGATLDQIAEGAGLSKPNLLYYFPSKEAIHTELLSGLMDVWLDPLREMAPDGDPYTEIMTYVRRKLEMSRDMPRESRLFANEILQGAPRMMDGIDSTLKPLVDEKAAVIGTWMAEGKLKASDPHHLLFSIWALTQHYADFDVQVRAVLGPSHDPFIEADNFIETVYARLLRP
jgi:TetR/AcrR family transcriptional regulator